MVSWGFKKAFHLIASGFTTGYTVEKYSEIKETTKDWSSEDRETVNKILSSGNFQLPSTDERKEKKEDIEW